jgi:hypothetical protein
MGRPLVIAVIIAGLAATSLPAQETWVPQPGQRIKIKSSGARGDFFVQGAGPDTLHVVKRGNTQTHAVSISSISQLSVSSGERTRMAGLGRGAGLGFVVGAGIGGAIGFASGSDSCEGGCGMFESTAGEKALIAGAVIGVLSAAIGGALGAANPGERWRRVPVRRVTVAPSSGGFAAAMSLAF